MEEKPEVDKLFDLGLQEKKNSYKKYRIEFKLNIIKLMELNISLHKIEEK